MNLLKCLLSLAMMFCFGVEANASHLLVQGSVSAGGKGLSGVVVSDGYSCCVTDAKGNYHFEVNDDARFVFVSTPSAYAVACIEATVPQFYHRIDRSHPDAAYDFTLIPIKGQADRFVFLAQADVQVTAGKELTKGYAADVRDMRQLANGLSRDGRSVFFIDLGDIVGNAQWLYPQYLQTISPLNMPVFRAVGNHDMEMPPSRTYEGSTKTFERFFGPVNYSFNRGRAHFIILDDCFCTGRDYQYIGYIPEQTFRWLEQDLSHVRKGSLVFVAMHIPCSPTDKLVYNQSDMEYVSNAAALWETLRGYQVHFLSGHTHWNQNLQYTDSIMEHNTAAVCGIWWKAGMCMDGTPRGCGVYEVDGDSLTWYYHSFGHSRDYQMRVYRPGAIKEYPHDIVANVWNYDTKWKVEWLEDGKVMGQMTQFTDFDPEAAAICADKEKVEYDWISPAKTTHLFHATPKNAAARITVRVTDRFGHIYEAQVGKAMQ